MTNSRLLTATIRSLASQHYFERLACKTTSAVENR